MTGGASRTLGKQGSLKRELLSISQLEVAPEQGDKGTRIPGTPLTILPLLSAGLAVVKDFGSHLERHGTSRFTSPQTLIKGDR